MKRGKPLVRQTRFIEDDRGKIYLPRPSSWLSGMLRHRWVKHTLKKKPSIAGPEYWCKLGNKHDVKRLFEYEDGTWEIITYENQ